MAERAARLPAGHRTRLYGGVSFTLCAMQPRCRRRGARPFSSAFLLSSLSQASAAFVWGCAALRAADLLGSWRSADAGV